MRKLAAIVIMALCLIGGMFMTAQSNQVTPNNNTPCALPGAPNISNSNQSDCPACPACPDNNKCDGQSHSWRAIQQAIL